MTTYFLKLELNKRSAWDHSFMLVSTFQICKIETISFNRIATVSEIPSKNLVPQSTVPCIIKPKSQYVRSSNRLPPKVILVNPSQETESGLSIQNLQKFNFSGTMKYGRSENVSSGPISYNSRNCLDSTGWGVLEKAQSFLLQKNENLVKFESFFTWTYRFYFNSSTVKLSSLG